VGEGHISVLAREVCDALEASLPPVGETPRGVYVDATCGAGGHIEAVLERFAPERVVAFDRDETALERARARLSAAQTPILFVHAPFSALGPTLAELDVPALTRILREYGEEPDAPRIARAILEAQPKTTGALAQVVTDAMSHRQRRKLGLRIHPATRTFQAIRIHLNDELGELDTLPGLPIPESERQAPYAIPKPFSKGVTASADETDHNPRARSARLRVLERLV
jgi:16S rRNA (cytosine1402-N4)-methyltransferase